MPPMSPSPPEPAAARSPRTADLDERKAAILRAIVGGYVRLGEPVASKRLAEESGLGVSSATVRTEMASLETDGYITKGHTSAGRVPTDKGYRYFVDTLADAQAFGDQEREALEAVLLGARDLEDLLQRTTTVLSRLTSLAALVVAPSLERSRLRHVELLALGPTSVLAVMITDTGRVEKRVLTVELPLAEHDVARARHAVNEAAGGLRSDQAPDVIAGVAAGAPPELRGLLEAVADAVRADLATAGSGDRIFVGGSANILAAGAFEQIEQVKQVYEALEEQVVLLQTVRSALDVGDPAVRIGSELPLVELAACSVVASRYSSVGEARGSVGVLGPRRMDYPRTLAAVQAVASSLEKALVELSGSA